MMTATFILFIFFCAFSVVTPACFIGAAEQRVTEFKHGLKGIENICKYAEVEFSGERDFPDQCVKCVCKLHYYECCSYGTMVRNMHKDCMVITEGCHERAVLKSDKSKPCPEVGAVLG